MENEKRKVGDYTVLCAVNIGSREIILACLLYTSDAADEL